MTKKIICQVEIWQKCVAGQVAEASSLIYPKRDAGATCTRPRIAVTEWRQPELKCSVVRSFKGLSL